MGTKINLMKLFFLNAFKKIKMISKFFFIKFPQRNNLIQKRERVYVKK